MRLPTLHVFLPLQTRRASSLDGQARDRSADVEERRTEGASGAHAAKLRSSLASKKRLPGSGVAVVAATSVDSDESSSKLTRMRIRNFCFSLRGEEHECHPCIKRLDFHALAHFLCEPESKIWPLL